MPNQPQSNQFSATFLPFTALWALAESAMGGVLHALHIPITGFVVGGMAVLIIGWMAATEPRPRQAILTALGVVLLIKATVNPHSPPTAYLAVAFQGFLGAVLLGSWPRQKLAILVFAVLAMIESAFQRIVVLTIFVGQSFWEALDVFAIKTAADWGFDVGQSLSMWIFLIFGGLYAVWGLCLGFWIIALPNQMAARRHLYQDLPTESLPAQDDKKRIPWLKMIWWMMVVIAVCSLPLGLGQGYQRSLFLVARTLALMGVYFWLLLPWWIRWIKKSAPTSQNVHMKQTLFVMDQLSQWMLPLYRHLKIDFSGPTLWKEWMLGLMVLTERSAKTKQL